MYVCFDRPCHQAGSALKGKVVIEVGKDGAKLVQNNPDGLALEVQLFGAEKVYWAIQMQHGQALKNLVPGPNRREQANILIDFKQQLAQLNPMQLQTNKSKVEHPFSIPLPENLPSSLCYFGEFMSQIACVYELKANLVSLRPSAAGPEGTVVLGNTSVVRLRARDPPVIQGIT